MYFLAYTAKIGFLGQFPDWESAKEACEALADETDNYHIEQHEDSDDLRNDW